MDMAKDFKRWKDGNDDVYFIPEQYFAGTDICVYINNENIIEISSINFVLRQNLKPIYGYKSFTYDKMAVGNRIIVGSFLVPFTHKDYLLSFLGNINIEEEDIIPESDSFSGSLSSEAVDYLKEREVLSPAEEAFAEEAITYIPLNEEASKIAKGLGVGGGGTSNGAGGGGSRDNGTGDNVNRSITSVMRQRNNDNKKNTHAYDSFNFSNQQRNILKEQGFSIYISYGRTTIADTIETYKNAEFSYNQSVSQILSKGVDVIKGVHIRSAGKTIELNNTVYEQMEFIAKDVL